MKSESNQIELAWAAGLFEGEGCIHFRTAPAPRKSVRITLSLCSTDEDVVDRFAHAVGYDHYTQLKRYTGQNKAVYRWQTQSTEKVKMVLGKLMPFLGERRTAKAIEALAARKEYEDGYCRD